MLPLLEKPLKYNNFENIIFTKMQYFPQFHRKNITPDWYDLVEEFPEIFLHPSKEVSSYYEQYGTGERDFPMNLEDVCNLRYGFECNIGWKSIIWEFCEKVRALSERAREHGHEAYYKSFILKEKFGSLRDQGDWEGKDAKLYYDDYRKISHEMEEKSYKTCELCGKPAECKNRKGWMFVRCDSCELKEHKKFN